jgi:hypothetical protein
MGTPNNAPQYVQTPYDVLSDPELTPYDKLVWQAIKYRQGQHSHAWPSKKTICKDTGGLSKSTVKRSIKNLKKRGILRVQWPRSPGRKRTNKYYISEQKKGFSQNPITKERVLTEPPKGFSQNPKLYTYEQHRNSNEFLLSRLLFSEIQKRKPDFKKPNLSKWAVHIDRMIRLDNRKPEKIREVILWCQQDSGNGGDWKGWQDNILSAEKLRKQFDKLELAMNRKGYDGTNRNDGDKHPEPYIR